MADLEKMKLICECGGKTELIETAWKGIRVRAWKCRKCGEELIHPEDAQRALEISRARKKLVVKLRKVGKSSVITVPQVLKNCYNLSEGRKAEWSVAGKDMFLIKMS
jgi:ubiquitin C-terminal hydrolase